MSPHSGRATSSKQLSLCISTVTWFAPARQICCSSCSKEVTSSVVLSLLYIHYKVLKCLYLCRAEISTTPYLHMRYEGTDYAMMIAPFETGNSNGESHHGNFRSSFKNRCVFIAADCLPVNTPQMHCSTFGYVFDTGIRVNLDSLFQTAPLSLMTYESEV